jgi:energy-converting hydrogenase Eha subunit F
MKNDLMILLILVTTVIDCKTSSKRRRNTLYMRPWPAVGIRRSSPTAALLKSEIPSSAALSSETHTQVPPSQTSTASTPSEVCTTNPSHLCPNQVKTPNITCCPGEYLQEYEYYEIVKSKGKSHKSIPVHYYCCTVDPDYNKYRT